MELEFDSEFLLENALASTATVTQCYVRNFLLFTRESKMQEKKAVKQSANLRAHSILHHFIWQGIWMSGLGVALSSYAQLYIQCDYGDTLKSNVIHQKLKKKIMIIFHIVFIYRILL